MLTNAGGTGHTYYGAAVEQKSLVTGTWTNGVLTNDTWAVTDLDSDGFSASGAPLKTVAKGVVLKEGEAAQDLTTEQGFDAFGQLKSKKDTAGVTVQENTYDLAGRVLTSTGPEFSPQGGGSTQVVTHAFYDPWGHVTESYKTSTAAASTKAGWTTNSYDICGRVTEVKTWLWATPAPDPTDPAAVPQSKVTTTYDGLGRTYKVENTTVSGLPARTAYDARGNVRAAWAAGACTTTEDYVLTKASRATYDELGRKVTATAPASGAASFTYTRTSKLLGRPTPMAPGPRTPTTPWAA